MWKRTDSTLRIVDPAAAAQIGTCRCPRAGEEFAGVERPGPDPRRQPIDQACDDWPAGSQSGSARRLARDSADDRSQRWPRRREERGIQPGGLDLRLIPCGPTRNRALCKAGAAQTTDDVIEGLKEQRTTKRFR